MHRWGLLQLVGKTYSEGCLEHRWGLLQQVGETYSEDVKSMDGGYWLVTDVKCTERVRGQWPG